MDGKTVLYSIHQCELYFSLVSVSNKYIQALFAVRLLQGPEYTWFITWQYILKRNSPARLNWPKLKKDLKKYFRLADYAFKAH